jgi:hypothetical protein
MTPNFEIALNKNQFPDYFKGNGQYFTRDPDWGTQLHIINWQGLCTYLEPLETAIEILTDAFSEYLNSVEHTKNDASDLLENIGCYYYLRNKHPFLSKDGFDLVRDATESEKQKISHIMAFLGETIEANNDAQDLELYNRRMRKLIDDGGPTNTENL